MYFEADPPFAPSDPIVLKIGGSLTRRAEALLPILNIADRSERPLAVVAGGGALADAVRVAQHSIGFSDAVAHRMAILAMHQNALMMASLAASLTPLERLADIQSSLAEGTKSIWLPLKECESDRDLPVSWDATSDAIAARLAERLGGLPLVFVKSREADGRCHKPVSLCGENLIDPVAAQILERAELPFSVVNAGTGSPLAGLLGVAETVDVDSDA